MSTKLIVSVRSASEASDALAAGADVIDVKDPRRGSLGRATGRIWRAVLGRVKGAKPVSVAMGELAELRDGLPPVPPPSIAFAKYGLSGCGERSDWQGVWERTIQCLDTRTAAVAVIYADWKAAAAPSPEAVIDAGAASGCSIVLVDTFFKSSLCLFDHLPPRRLEPLLQRIRRAGMGVALAGSLGERHLATALCFTPEYIAVRGAVCRGSRRGPIDPQQIRHWVTVIRRSDHVAPSLA